MRKKVFFAAVFLVTMLFAVVGWARLITVGSSGCDYTSIQAVFDNEDIEPGDVVEIRADIPGGSKTYNEAVVLGTDDMGSSSNPLTIRAREGDSIIIEATSGNNYTWTHSYGCSYVTYENLAFKNGDIAAFRLRYADGVCFRRCSFFNTNSAGIGLYIDAQNTGLQISNCVFRSEHGKGCFVNADCTNCTVINSDFCHNGNYGIQGLLGGFSFYKCNFSYNQSHGFYAVGNTSDILVQDCKAIGNYNEASAEYRHGFCFSDGVSNVTIKHCKAYDVDIALDLQASNGDVHDIDALCCLFIGQGEGETENGTGIFISANNSSYSVSNVNVFNCTVGTNDPNSRGALFIGWYAQTSLSFKNNIFISTASTDVLELASGYTGYPNFDFNCYYTTKTDAFNDKGTHKAFTQWVSDSSQDNRSMFTNPFLASNYHLSRNSPCIDAGIKLSIHDDNWQDLAGNKIRYGTAPDIGCYEYKTWPTSAWGMLPWIGGRHKVQWTPYE